MPGFLKLGKMMPPTLGGHDHMNQAQQGMTGIGSLLSTWVAVGSRSQSLTQLAVSVGKTVVGNGPVTMGTMTTGPLVEVIMEVLLRCGIALAPLHGHRGGWMVWATGAAVMSATGVGVMIKGGGLTLAVGMMMDGTPPSTVVVRITSEKLMRSVITGGMEISVEMVTAV
jgi:hypothetical protein